MISISFDNWLLKFDKWMGAKKYNITLMWGNCATHSVNTADLKNVMVYFFPPNTTFETPLMDSGVIKNLKLLSDSQLVHLQLFARDGVPFQFSILDSLRHFYYAFYMVESETIVNCYKMVGPNNGERNKVEKRVD
jgi:hypothetical protein